MKNIKILLIAFIAVFSLNSCNEDMVILDTNYVAFAAPVYSAGVDVGGTNSVDVQIFTANKTGSDRSFEVTVDDSSNAAAGSYTVPSSFTIPGGTNSGILKVELSDTNLGIGVNSLVLNLKKSEGLSIGEAVTIKYIQNCTEVTATLDIVFDGYGSETSWAITDSLGGVVASKAEGDYADGQASVSEAITLCAGRSYTFTINDAYGDGLSYPADGTYSLKIGGAEKASGSGDFGASEATDFDTN